MDEDQLLVEFNHYIVPRIVNGRRPDDMNREAIDWFTRKCRWWDALRTSRKNAWQRTAFNAFDARHYDVEQPNVGDPDYESSEEMVDRYAGLPEARMRLLNLRPAPQEPEAELTDEQARELAKSLPRGRPVSYDEWRDPDMEAAYGQPWYEIVGLRWEDLSPEDQWEHLHPGCSENRWLDELRAKRELQDGGAGNT